MATNAENAGTTQTANEVQAASGVILDAKSRRQVWFWRSVCVLLVACILVVLSVNLPGCPSVQRIGRSRQYLAWFDHDRLEYASWSLLRTNGTLVGTRHRVCSLFGCSTRKFYNLSEGIRALEYRDQLEYVYENGTYEEVYRVVDYSAQRLVSPLERPFFVWKLNNGSRVLFSSFLDHVYLFKRDAGYLCFFLEVCHQMWHDFFNDYVRAFMRASASWYNWTVSSGTDLVVLSSYLRIHWSMSMVYWLLVLWDWTYIYVVAFCVAHFWWATIANGVRNYLYARSIKNHIGNLDRLNDIYERVPSPENFVKLSNACRHQDQVAKWVRSLPAVAFWDLCKRMAAMIIWFYLPLKFVSSTLLLLYLSWAGLEDHVCNAFWYLVSRVWPRNPVLLESVKFIRPQINELTADPIKYAEHCTALEMVTGLFNTERFKALEPSIKRNNTQKAIIAALFDRNNPRTPAQLTAEFPDHDFHANDPFNDLLSEWVGHLTGQNPLIPVPASALEKARPVAKEKKSLPVRKDKEKAPKTAPETTTTTTTYVPPPPSTTRLATSENDKIMAAITKHVNHESKGPTIPINKYIDMIIFAIPQTKWSQVNRAHDIIRVLDNTQQLEGKYKGKKARQILKARLRRATQIRDAVRSAIERRRKAATQPRRIPAEVYAELKDSSYRRAYAQQEDPTELLRDAIDYWLNQNDEFERMEQDMADFDEYIDGTNELLDGEFDDDYEFEFDDYRGDPDGSHWDEMWQQEEIFYGVPDEEFEVPSDAQFTIVPRRSDYESCVAPRAVSRVVEMIPKKKVSQATENEKQLLALNKMLEERDRDRINEIARLNVMIEHMGQRMEQLVQKFESLGGAAREPPPSGPIIRQPEEVTKPKVDSNPVTRQLAVKRVNKESLKPDNPPFHTFDDSVVVLADQSSNPVNHGVAVGAGIVSTAHDVSRYRRVLFKGSTWEIDAKYAVTIADDLVYLPYRIPGTSPVALSKFAVPQQGSQVVVYDRINHQNSQAPLTDAVQCSYPDLSTEAGACGAPVVCRDKIVGFHNRNSGGIPWTEALAQFFREARLKNQAPRQVAFTLATGASPPAANVATTSSAASNGGAGGRK